MVVMGGVLFAGGTFVSGLLAAGVEAVLLFVAGELTVWSDGLQPAKRNDAPAITRHRVNDFIYLLLVNFVCLLA